MWFSKKKTITHVWTPPKHKVIYPQWTFVRIIDTDDYYLILEKTKLKFISVRAFNSWNRPYVLTTEEAISDYRLWKSIGFAPGSVVESEVDRTRYFMSGKDPLDTERRLITTPDFWYELGFDYRFVTVVSLKELDFHKKGEDIIGIEV